ncbi:hypothetical protein ASC64_09465 [Nocardioides sp. Root122]|jgi:hypothetical protein|uniref:hypothetical protein n=1 Tax=Nocardioides TaxID=1839 RepID=UPI0007035AC3|nr:MULTISPECIES: hypothetical protein [Nocardioides]KQV70002.1 hypothetical protein ASC64_09465 [Nocardioides sp. Root122]MCK9825036.1 hypothetical protein [Nocardioides cavernae]
MNDNTNTLSSGTVATLVVDTEPYLSCDDCFERLDQFVDARVADPSHTDLEMTTHLAGCGVCAEEASALEELVRIHAAHGS